MLGMGTYDSQTGTQSWLFASPRDSDVELIEDWIINTSPSLLYHFLPNHQPTTCKINDLHHQPCKMAQKMTALNLKIPRDTKVLVYEFFGNPQFFIETAYATIEDHEEDYFVWGMGESAKTFAPFFVYVPGYISGDPGDTLCHYIELEKYDGVKNFLKQGHPHNRILWVKLTPWNFRDAVNERILGVCDKVIKITKKEAAEILGRRLQKARDDDKRSH